MRVAVILLTKLIAGEETLCSMAAGASLHWTVPPGQAPAYLYIHATEYEDSGIVPNHDVSYVFLLYGPASVA
jgi:hypothetical protein